MYLRLIIYSKYKSILVFWLVEHIKVKCKIYLHNYTVSTPSTSRAPVPHVRHLSFETDTDSVPDFKG